MYSGERCLRNAFVPACRQLLRAAYLGTLLATVALGRNREVLTLIGGGVFGNPIGLIWEAIQWSVNEIEPHLSSDLEVIVNGYNFGTLIDLEQEVLPAVHRTGAERSSTSIDRALSPSNVDCTDDIAAQRA